MRPVLYATLASLLLILGLIGVMEVRSLRAEYETRERQRLQDMLDSTLDQWEGDVENELAELRTQLTDESTRDQVLLQRRQRSSWFDAFYLWEGGVLTFPAEAPREDIAALRQEPCLAAAGDGHEALDHQAAARRYLSCITTSDPVSAFATSEAVEHLLAANDPTNAYLVLRHSPGLAFLRLNRASDFGISPYRVLSLRLQYLTTLQLRGDTVAAQVAFSQTMAELLTQDGPVLEQIRPLYEYPILPILQEGTRGGALDVELDEVWARAWRRLDAWKELRDRRWTDDALAQLERGPLLEVGPDGDPTWLLYELHLSNAANVAAFQLDQDALLRDVIPRFGRAMAPNVTIRDANGRVVYGKDQPYLVYRNFGRVLPTYLQVGFTESALPASAQDRAVLTQLALILMGLIVGAAALWGMVRSDRETARLIAAQRDFVTRVTHELKTPLAGIRLMAETLEMGAWSGPADVEAAAGRIISEADRLHARVNEVLRAAREDVVEEPQVIDASDLLRKLGAEWAPRMEQVGGALTVVAPDTLRIIARPGLLRDAITNLLDNALKYRREGRPLAVTARVRTERRSVVFEVVDNGMGVPPALRSSIFERFQRVEGPGRGKAGGHGLGLAFVADAARAHGGRVECRDGIEGGSRFLFRIPFKPAPQLRGTRS